MASIQTPFNPRII